MKPQEVKTDEEVFSVSIGWAVRREIKAYYSGLRNGLERFAWWKDGVQYVGSCGTTLQEALHIMQQEEAAILVAWHRDWPNEPMHEPGGQ